MEGPRSNPGTTTTGTVTPDDGGTNSTTAPVRSLAQFGLSRRNVVLGASVVGAAGLLAACGGGSSSTTASGGTTSDPSTSTGSSDDNGGGGGGGGGGGEKLASKSDVPVGGGVINQQAKVVVTQPTGGTFKAFTAVCTHQSCLVAKVADNEIICPCHGSLYSATDGSVKRGPAPSPLAPVAIKVSGNEIVEA